MPRSSISLCARPERSCRLTKASFNEPRLSWIAAKAGVSETPALFFASARFVLAVVCLVLFVRGFGRAFAAIGTRSAIA